MFDIQCRTLAIFCPRHCPPQLLTHSSQCRKFIGMDKKKVKIYEKGEKVLREKAKEVPIEKIKSVKIQNIIKKMEKSIAENDDAIAIAAPQVGEGLRIFVISEWTLNPPDPLSEEEPKNKNEFKNLVFINPKIIKL